MLALQHQAQTKEEILAEEQRGSAKLLSRAFDKGMLTHAELRKAVDDAKVNFQIVRWWWYGQPAIDKILGSIEVEAGAAGEVMQDLVDLNGEGVGVVFRVFPRGIPPITDGVLIELELSLKTG